METEKFTNVWKLNNTPLNNQQVKEESQGKFIKHLETNENENTTYQSCGIQQKQY